MEEGIEEEMFDMKVHCECCGEKVEVLFRRNWRLSSSPIPCPQFRKHLCMQCGGSIADSVIEEAKREAEERRMETPK
jgi:hypothetical protein